MCLRISLAPLARKAGTEISAEAEAGTRTYSIGVSEGRKQRNISKLKLLGWAMTKRGWLSPAFVTVKCPSIYFVSV